jgi:Right handed beta helix region
VTRVAACLAVAGAGLVGVTSVVLAGPLIPPPSLPPIVEVPGAPDALRAPEPPRSTPDIVDNSSTPDACTGGVLKPRGRLQRFVNSLKAGETGCLRRGTYEGGVDLAKPKITLRSYPGKRATIRGGQVRISPRATGATLKKLRLVTDQFSPLIYASRAVIADNEITNNHTGICIHIDRYPGTPVPTGIVIQRNRIHDCGRLPAANHDHGIYIAVAHGTIIRDNLIYDNADRGVQLWPFADRTQIIDNVIDSNGQGVIFGRQSDHNLVEGNIITNSNVRHNIESTESTAQDNVVRGNCLWSTVGGYYGGEPPNSGVLPDRVGFTYGSNTIADPRFVNRRDFEPAPGSPCARFGPER